RWQSGRVQIPPVQDIASVDVLWSYALLEQPIPRLQYGDTEAEHIDRPGDGNSPPHELPGKDQGGHSLGRGEIAHEEGSAPRQHRKVISVVEELQDMQQQQLSEPIEDKHRGGTPDPLCPPPEPRNQRGHDYHSTGQGDPEYHPLRPDQPRSIGYGAS